MTAHEQTQERPAGGSLGKAVGRAKQLFGSALGNSQLDREGRLQQVQVDAQTEAIERGEEAEQSDAEAKLAITKAETETERRELETRSPEKDTDELLADKQRVEEEAEAAAAEAGQVGGSAPIESDDPAQQPLIESGQGESEGFELAEKRLQDIASHGDEHRFPDRDVRPAEDREQVERGEADQAIPADG